MAWLPDGEKILKISLYVLVQLPNVKDGQTDRHRMPAIAALSCIASHGKKGDVCFGWCIYLRVQHVTRLNTNAQDSEAVRVLAKRKAVDQQSEVDKKCLKGNFGFICKQNV